MGIDVALGALPFEENAINRSTLFEFAPGIELRTCSAEDLVVFKAFAARAKDWMDIEGVLIRNARQLDWKHIRAQLEPLVQLKGAPEILEQLEEKRILAEKA